MAAILTMFGGRKQWRRQHFRRSNFKLHDWTFGTKQEQHHIMWLISREQKPVSSKVPILVFLTHIYSQTADAQYL